MNWVPVILIMPYLFLMLWIYRNLLQIKSFTVSHDPSTFVSVIVACRNEQENLPVLLKHIAAQNYRSDLFEVIVVNDNSTDQTLQTASSIKGIPNLRFLDNIGSGKKQAIRTGINSSRGFLIITTDADCVMNENWIRTIAAFCEEHNPDLIICPVQLEMGRGFLRKFEELEFLSLQGVTAGSAIAQRATMCNGANLAFPREAYLNNSEKLHDDIPSGDDIFLLQSIKKRNNSKICWLESANALVTTRSASTVAVFMKQRTRWISKAGSYNDTFTLILGIVTFVTILTQLFVLSALLAGGITLEIFLVIVFLKMIPDFLILMNTTARYSRKELLWWVFPSQLVYPFYVFAVAVLSKFSPQRWTTSSPSQKGT
jgi:glycosyltransferase involved in cell wall biosynthesis